MRILQTHYFNTDSKNDIIHLHLQAYNLKHSTN